MNGMASKCRSAKKNCRFDERKVVKWRVIPSCRPTLSKGFWFVSSCPTHRWPNTSSPPKIVVVAFDLYRFLPLRTKFCPKLLSGSFVHFFPARGLITNWRVFVLIDSKLSIDTTIIIIITERAFRLSVFPVRMIWPGGKSFSLSRRYREKRHFYSFYLCKTR